MAASIGPWPLVRTGDRDHPVLTLQYLLRARDHAVAADGTFGPETDAAVRAFQGRRTWRSTASSARDPGARW
jgi:peptidoglycan hydrolase-like protein with peptidoglycan-binding domain